MKAVYLSLRLLVIMTILTGILYTFLMTAAARLLFPDRRSGSIVYLNGKAAGSVLIGQQFGTDRYFHARPSAIDYRPMPSAATNMAVSSSRLLMLYNQRRKEFLAYNGLKENTPVPLEMLFSSASGVDPHCTPDAIRLQSARVSAARGFDSKKQRELGSLIDSLSSKPQLGIFGSGMVNVFLLNLRLDELSRNEPGRIESGRIESGRIESGRIESGRNEPIRNELGSNKPGRNEK